AMRASVAEMPLNAVWGGSGRGELQDNVRRRMQGILDAYRAGVNVIGVDIKKADPPEKVADAFQKVNVAQQLAERDKNNAQAWAQQTLARAEGEAAAFDKVYAEYKLAPEVTKRRMYYETMERVLSANDKVVVEAHGVTPYLPLPELRRRAQDPAPAAGGQ
ncbi:MAG: SPFH domain-containing protein, partial [Novosphingobium sp.]